jgi:hypothetical protein
MDGPWMLTPGDLRSPSGARVAYTVSVDGGAATVQAHTFGDSDQEAILVGPCSREDFDLWYTAPVLAGNVVFLGELLKWAVVSPQRVTVVDSDEARGLVTVTAVGGPGEAISLYFISAGNLAGPPQRVDYTFDASGYVVVTAASEGAAVRAMVQGQ